MTPALSNGLVALGTAAFAVGTAAGAALDVYDFNPIIDYYLITANMLGGVVAGICAVVIYRGNTYAL